MTLRSRLAAGGLLARVRLAPLLVAVIAPALIGAQENPLVRDHPGSWQVAPPITLKPGDGFTPEERAVVTASINRLLDILGHVPQMAPPAGFQVIPHAFVGLDNLDRSDGPRIKYMRADVDVNLAPYERTSRGVDANERDTAGAIDIKVNDPQPIGASESGLFDDEGMFFRDQPEPVDTVHGYPVFEAGNGDRWIMIRRNDVPFFAPVTRERYMLAVIKDNEAQLKAIGDRRAKIPSSVPASIVATVDEGVAHFKEQLANSQRAYASMSVADRRAPAYLAGSTGTDAPAFAISSDGGAEAVLCVNPALMAPGVPRTAPQLLAIGISGKDDLWPGLAGQLDKELDWAALDAFAHGR